MKKIFLVIFVIIFLSSVFLFYNNNNSRLIIYSLSRKSNIKSGDLIYRVNLFEIIPAANAILKLEHIEEYNGQKVYHLNATANSLNFWSKLFNPYAILDSYVDIETHDPILFKQKAVISPEKLINKEVLYDQKNGIMTVYGIRRQILPNTQDPLSAIFNIRRMDFDKIKEIEMNINTNQKNYILKGIVQSQDISIHKKTYKIAFLETTIKRRDKSPYHQSKISIVLLKDKENIPILIKVFANGMLINARLIDIK